MLSSLQIENYVLIQSLCIQFERGMTVITGETGAGKSIIMGALSLILGNRADSSVLFDKTRKCYVEAVFDIRSLGLSRFFEDNDLDYQENTIIRREILEGGKSRAFINDTPVTLPILRELSSLLIDIHSQHQNLLLRDADFRIHVIDAFAQTEKLLADYQCELKQYKEKDKMLSALLMEQQAKLERKDYLEFVYKELQEANLLDNEQETIEKELNFLSNAETIKNNLFQIQQLLVEREESVLLMLREAQSLCATISSFRSDIEEVYKRIDFNYLDIKDLSRDIELLNEKIEYDPERLNFLRTRLDFIYDLEQKHHVVDYEGLLAKKESIAIELDSFTADQEQIAAVSAQREVHLNEAKKYAKVLSQRRKAILKEFESQILEKVKNLGMPDAQFFVKIISGDALQNNGIDDIQFLFSSNRGISVAELEKVASGGEMSRFMLALKSTISNKIQLPTIVFDEIDVGISGEIAIKVAKMLRDISQVRQLLVITHLPQIAAKGVVHYQVYKENEGNYSRTKIQKLNQESRLVEIAKMISGDNQNIAALQTAKELIKQ